MRWTRQHCNTIFAYPPAPAWHCNGRPAHYFDPDGVIFSVFTVLIHIYSSLHLPALPPCKKMQRLPDELNCLWIHGVRRFGLHGALFHGISTLNEWQGCFCIVQSLSKLFHLVKTVNSVFLKKSFSNSVVTKSTYFEKLDFEVLKSCEWSPEKIEIGYNSFSSYFHRFLMV